MTINVETHFISGCLYDQTLYHRAVEMGLRYDEFSTPSAAAVWLAMGRLTELGQDISHEALITILGPASAQRLAEVEHGPMTQNIDFVIQEMKATKIARLVAEKSSELGRLASARGSCDSMSPLVRKHEEITDLLSAKTTAEPSSFAHLSEQVMRRAEERVITHTAGRPFGIPTGIAALDRFLYGWTKGAMYTLAARSGVGKTTIAVNFATTAAMYGKPTVFYTIEMSASEIVEKVYSLLGKIEFGNIQRGSMSDTELDTFTRVLKEHAKLPLFVRSLRYAAVETIISDIRAYKRREKVELVVIDYIQLIRTMEKHRSRHEEISSITGRIKELARELQIPIILLAQLNRKATEEHEPDKTHLKDSGSIEQDSDVVLLLFKDVNEKHWLKVDKNRKGREGKFSVNAALQFNYFGDEEVGIYASPY